MRQIVKDANMLKENDLISILLFGLYKLMNIPEYAYISELAYVLDKDSLFKLCSVYGGMTVRVPELSEIENISKVLLIIDLMYNGFSFEEAYDEANVSELEKDYILKAYDVLLPLIEGFINAKQN